MSARLPVIAGAASGVLAAVVLLVGLVAFVPDPGAPTPPPSVGGSGTARPPASASAAATGPLAGASPSGAVAGEDSFHVGEPAPALVVPQVGGGTIDLASLRGKPVWVNFMATWCPECRDEFPRMNGFAVRYADQGLIVIAVDVREDMDTVAAFAQSLDARFPVGIDADGRAQQAWGALALPIHYWVDAQGIVRDGAFGGIGPDVMAAGLASIMPGVSVTP